MSTPVRLSWTLQSPASREDTWALVADTDRFNRAAGLAYSYAHITGPDGVRRTIGSLTRQGVRLRWEERPFRFQAPAWWRSERIFEGGPAARLVTTARLKPTGDTCELRYAVEVTPRSALLRPLVALELSLFTRPKLDRALASMISALGVEEGEFDPAPPPLSPDAEALVEASCASIEPPALAARLAALLREGPLQAQDRIRPYALARELDIPRAQAVGGLLRAARAGVLSVRWDVLCPGCRGRNSWSGPLKARGRTLHCYSCELSFDATLVDALAVSFRPAPTVRTFELPMYCVGSPARRPRVVAQERLEPMGRAEFTLALEPGPYRISALGALAPAAFLVEEGAEREELLLHVDYQGFGPPRLKVAPGERPVAVASESPAPVSFLIERRLMPEDELTAGELLADPAARELIPEGALDPAFSAEVHPLAVVVGAGDLNALRAARAGRGARQVQEVEGRLQATFEDAAAGLDAALAVAGVPWASAGLSMGPLVEAREGDAVRTWGRAAIEAREAMERAGPGRLGICPAAGAALTDALAARGLETRPAVGGAVWLLA